MLDGVRELNAAAQETAAPAKPLPVIVIEPTQGWQPLNLRELWAYRDLLYFLTWRDLRVRYKQTVVGAAWAIIQPVFTMVVFSLFFGELAKIPSDDIPYPIFAYTALVPWSFFANTLLLSSNSLVLNSILIRKVYFPRLIIPFSSVLAGLLDFVLAFAVLLVMMLFYGIVPSLNLLLLPVFVLFALITSAGVGLWLTTLNVRFRDVRYIVPFLTQAWMFATPIAYPSSLIENKTLRILYGLNPMTGVVEGFRWVLLNNTTAPGLMFWVSGMVSVIVFVGGLYYFRRMERTFADII